MITIRKIKKGTLIALMALVGTNVFAQRRLQLHTSLGLSSPNCHNRSGTSYGDNSHQQQTEQARPFGDGCGLFEEQSTVDHIQVEQYDRTHKGHCGSRT